MRFWGKDAEKDSSERSVARAALDGASREVWLQVALKTLANAGNADRIGVWMEASPNSSRDHDAASGFHGVVWDRENGEMPGEWANLSPETVLPEELRNGGRILREDLQALPTRPIIGPLIELGSALWVPIARNKRLKGVILAGSRGRRLVVSRASAESVAAELALASELEQEERISRMRTEDLALARRTLGTRADEADTLLAILVKSCTGKAPGEDALGAAFAVIGALEEEDGSPENVPVEFHWRSGDEAWTRAIESPPLSTAWRRALKTRRVISSEPQTGWAQSAVARIVAFPLESEGRLLGILVAGLPSGAASLTTLDRLELRAGLAAATLREKRRTEEESQRAGWRQKLLESLGEPLLLLDGTGRVTLSSRGAKELAGQISNAASASPSAGAQREYFDEFFCGRDRERIQAWLRKALEPGPASKDETAEAELHNRVRVRVRRVAPAQGAAPAVLLEPLTTREPVQETGLAEVELRNVIEWLEEGVVLFDARENVRMMNTRFEQIAGLAPGESGKFNTLDGLIGRLASQSAEPERFEERWRELARGIEGGVREELQMVRPAPHILERASRPLVDPFGRQLGRVEIYRDLTAQRVFQSKLLQTEKLAALGQMVSGIAHELSNPLTSILGYAQRLVVRTEGSALIEEVHHIHHEAERASAILRQLLLNARDTAPERRQVSLNQVVQRAMELQRFRLAGEKIRMEVDLEPALPFVRADAGHLQQVLMNLVSNAQQALEQQGQGGTIRLRTRRIGEHRVLLEVEDNGPGIPRAIQARIFDPFFTTKPPGVGTGLGLAIVLSVVREHGGQVHVLSPPQGGTIFQIELPAASQFVPLETVGGPSREAKRGLSEEARAPASAAESTSAHAWSHRAHVLVVEDEPTVARLIADVLEDEGMQVEVLQDGRKALERTARKTYDLVICDMKMPGLDGQHFYKLLERTGNPLRSRFLFVTGDIIAAQTREFLERNGLPHLAKPFRVEELTEKVQQVLKNKVHRGPSAAEGRKAARSG